MDIKNDIVKSFFKRVLVAMAVTCIFSFTGIYYFQNYIFSSFLAKNIQNHVNRSIYKYDQDLGLSDKDVLQKDIKDFMQKIGFIYIELYDKNKEMFFTIHAKDEKYKNAIKLLRDHNKYTIHTLPKDNKMNYNFFEIPEQNYFLQIFYPVYKNGMILGYIEGISYVDQLLVDRYKRGLSLAIVTVIITILIFSLIIFPIIYLAYKKMNLHQQELLESNLMTIKTLGHAIALRDSDTSEHNYRVTIYAILFAEHLNLNVKDIKKIIKGALLHDVGKIGISDNILLKNGQLDNEEFEIMRTHVENGIKIVEGNVWLEDSIDIIKYHHEKFNGSGYPNKIEAQDIPVIARVFSIVDAFDALTSKRPYKEPFSYDESIQILQNGKEIHFDPVLIDSFNEISSGLYYEIRSKTQDELKKLLDKLIKKYFF